MDDAFFQWHMLFKNNTEETQINIHGTVYENRIRFSSYYSQVCLSAKAELDNLSGYIM